LSTTILTAKKHEFCCYYQGNLVQNASGITFLISND